MTKEERKIAFKKWYYSRPKDERNSYIKKLKETDPKKLYNYHKNWSLNKLYNIDLEDYNRMFTEQEGCCGICKRHQSEFKTALCVDHCHTTGKVRELLCDNCNTAIGKLGSIEALEEAINYFKKHI